jgi:hypothetical protein
MTLNLAELSAHIKALSDVDFGAGGPDEWSPAAEKAALYLRHLRDQIEDQAKEPQS